MAMAATTAAASAAATPAHTMTRFYAQRPAAGARFCFFSNMLAPPAMQRICLQYVRSIRTSYQQALMQTTDYSLHNAPTGFFVPLFRLCFPASLNYLFLKPIAVGAGTDAAHTHAGLTPLSMSAN